MKLLLTNDDGIEAAGIRILAEVLARSHEVYIIAPHDERSACSNAITVRTPLTLYTHGEGRFALSGFPADCVNVGMHAGIIPEVDMVISGMNHGPNLGEDIIFSGTVAGARTGAMYGKPSLAVSVDSYHRVSGWFHEAAEFVAEFIARIPLPSGHVLYNINYPDRSRSSIKGVRFTSAGTRKYNDCYDRSPGPDGTTLLMLAGKIDSVPLAGTDITELANGYISVTPLLDNGTDRERLAILQEMDPPWQMN